MNKSCGDPYRGGSIIADGLKRHLVCRQKAAALVAAIQNFAGAAYRVLAKMITSSLRFRATVAALEIDHRAFSTKLKTDCLRRIDRELDHRIFYQKRMASAAADPRTIERSSGDPRVHATQVMWDSSRAGILKANLRPEARALSTCMSDYNATLQRWLLR